MKYDSDRRYEENYVNHYLLFSQNWAPVTKVSSRRGENCTVATNILANSILASIRNVLVCAQKLCIMVS